MAESANKQLLSALTEGHDLRSSARTSNSSNYRSSETVKPATSSSKKNSAKQKTVQASSGSGSGKCKQYYPLILLNLTIFY